MNNKLDRRKLLDKINSVSFAIDDAKLYLDTHPCDEEALTFIQEKLCIRNELLSKYAEYYSPLTVDSSKPNCHWDWINEPMPWEGGMY